MNNNENRRGTSIIELTDRELQNLSELKKKYVTLKNLLNNAEYNIYGHLLKQYKYLKEFKNILGNFNNDLSFVACLMAKQYLLKNHNISNDIDMSIKAQGAKGLDIDETTIENERCIAEIKTIHPYGKDDFGSKQREFFRADFKKLQSNNAKYKYMFVTEEKSFNILKEKYISELIGIKTVLLPDGQSF